MNNEKYEELDALKPLAKPGTKFTILGLGGGLMGCDAKLNATSKGWINSHQGRTLAWAKPRARKLKCLITVLKHGAILLEGHRADDDFPIFEGDIVENGIRSMILDGKGGRFVDAAGDSGDSLIAYLKERLICHTLAVRGRLILLKKEKEGHGERDAVDPYFNVKLIHELGPSLDLDPPEAPAPKRKQLLTDVMKERLKACRDLEPPKILYKLFMPEGTGTWLLCSMEEDGDTMWAVCDIGMGCVEYGTVSLEELETTVGPTFKMPMERDIHFDGKGLQVRDLVQLDNLQTIPRPASV